MDVFDGEPYADLMPRWPRRSLGWTLLILGKPVAEVELDVQRHITAQYPRVKRVVEAMTGVTGSDRPVLLGYNEGPWSLEYDALGQLVKGALGGLFNDPTPGVERRAQT